MTQPTMDPARVLSPGEVAELFAVNPKTITRWARSGKLPYFRTPGGHRRFERDTVDQLLVTARSWTE